MLPTPFSPTGQEKIAQGKEHREYATLVPPMPSKIGSGARETRKTREREGAGHVLAINTMPGQDHGWFPAFAFFSVFRGHLMFQSVHTFDSRPSQDCR